MPLALGAVAFVLYAQGLVRLRRRRRDLVSWVTAASFTAGVLVALLAVVSPLDRVADGELLTAHMAQHLLLGDVAPLLLVLGLRGPIAFFAVPAPVLRALGHVGAVRAALRFVLRPAVGFTLWVAALYAWHVPAVYDAAIAHPALHDAEHASFLVTGLLVWTQIVDPTRRAHLGAGARAGYAAGILLAGMPLAELLLASRPLYPHYAQAMSRPFGWSAGIDQMRAALAMMGEQVMTLVPAAALLVWSHAEDLGKPATRIG